MRLSISVFFFFFFNDTAPTEIYTLSLHDALPIGSRRVHVARVSAHPDSAWVTQQARNLAMTTEDGTVPARFLIHDRDCEVLGPLRRGVPNRGDRGDPH